jgi:superfamily II DNA or RNA helicase
MRHQRWHSEPMPPVGSIVVIFSGTRRGPKEEFFPVSRWQQFISRFFPSETDVLATVDASEEGDALTVTLTVPGMEDGTEALEVLAMDPASGRVRTREGQHRLSEAAQRLIAALPPPEVGARYVAPKSDATAQKAANAQDGATADSDPSPLAKPRTVAITVPEAQIPETLRALRAIAAEAEANDDTEVDSADSPSPAAHENGAVAERRSRKAGVQITETSNSRAIKLAEKRALQYEYQVDFAGDDAIAVQAQIVSNDGKVRLNPDELRPLVPPAPLSSAAKRRGKPAASPSDADKPRWVRQGKTYYMAPSEVASEAQPFIHGNLTLEGDAVPFFLAKQLKQLGRNGRVVASDAVKEARVEPAPLEPVSILDLDEEGWLAVDVSYRAAEQSFTEAEMGALSPDAKYIRRGNVWVPIDRKANTRLHDALGKVERTLGARRDAAGKLRVAPGRGDEARRVLLDAAEIDEGAAFQKLLADLAGFKTIEPLPHPIGLRADLRPYQTEGFRWLAFLRKYYLNGVLADDMGLGKTLVTLSLLQYAKEHPDAEKPDPTLIVCPTSCADNWLDEAQKFTPGLRLVRYIGPDRERILDDPPDVLVTTYETLRRDMGYLQRQSWDYVILDEAQKIKNPITDTARACRQLLTRHRLAVTGTPIENRLDELWALFDFLMPGYLGSQARFRRDYDGPITRDKSVGAAEALKRKIAPFVLRRMKEQVAQDLPPKLYVARECKMTREQSRHYERIAGEGRERVMQSARDGNVTMNMSILASLTQLKQICCHPALLEDGAAAQQIDGRSGKFEMFKDELADRLDAGDKILVFSQYAEMCRIIQRHLNEAGIPSLYLDGQTRNRQELVRTFQNDPAIKVFVLSLRAAGFGITLTAASTVIHYDRWWNPAVENQATDRAYRIGQQRSVQVVQFRTRDTIEEKIDKLLTSKTELFGDVIEEDLNGKSVTREELLGLFAYSPLSEGATEEGLPLITPGMAPPPDVAEQAKFAIKADVADTSAEDMPAATTARRRPRRAPKEPDTAGARI